MFATGWAIKVHPIAEAALTQLVECLAVNQNVVGSSPASGVNFVLIISSTLSYGYFVSHFLTGNF